MGDDKSASGKTATAKKQEDMPTPQNGRWRTFPAMVSGGVCGVFRGRSRLQNGGTGVAHPAACMGTTQTEGNIDIQKRNLAGVRFCRMCGKAWAHGCFSCFCMPNGLFARCRLPFGTLTLPGGRGTIRADVRGADSSRVQGKPARRQGSRRFDGASPRRAPGRGRPPLKGQKGSRTAWTKRPSGRP